MLKLTLQIIKTVGPTRNKNILVILLATTFSCDLCVDNSINIFTYKEENTYVEDNICTQTGNMFCGMYRKLI